MSKVKENGSTITTPTKDNGNSCNKPNPRPTNNPSYNTRNSLIIIVATKVAFNPIV